VPNTDVNAVNLEHILPLNPSDAWKHVDAELAKAYYNRLGNLTLMSRKMNTAVANAGFAQKAAIYENEEFKLTRDLGTRSGWDIQQIETRQGTYSPAAR
jgi:hypothetical protein